MDTNTNEAPIGYWLKHLDRLIDATLDGALADRGLGRRHWQALNVLRDGPQDAAGLAEALRPFWTEGAATPDDVVAELARRGWVAGADAGRWALTPDGQAAHGELAGRIGGRRRRMMDGLTAEDYRATVAVLRRMAGNLEAVTGA